MLILPDQYIISYIQVNMKMGLFGKVPTYAQIAKELKILNAVAAQLTKDVIDNLESDSNSEKEDVSNEVKALLMDFAADQKRLRRKIQFYDFKPSFQITPTTKLEQVIALTPTLLSMPGSFRKKRIYSSRKHNRGPYRSYTSQQKNHVVYLFGIGLNFASISKRLEIPQKNVVRWCKEGYRNAESSKRIADFQMELTLKEWVKQQSKNGFIKKCLIQKKAKELSTNPHFKASRGWLKNFMRRLKGQVVKTQE